MHVKNDAKDYQDLKLAVNLLQSPSLTAKIFNLIGKPIESLVQKLPKAAVAKIHDAAKASLFAAADGALWSMNNLPGENASTKVHKVIAACTGAAGGFFGYAGLIFELPITTVIMMRSIADVARSEGFDIDDFATKVSCVEVFGLGGHTDKDDDAELGYYSGRAVTNSIVSLLEKELVEAAIAREAVDAAARHAFNQFTPEQSAKWLAKLIEAVANRFGVTISEKVAVQAAPVIGAITGAAVNTLFTNFYQDMAKGHFIVKRLEKKYGADAIKVEYEKLARA